MRKFIIGEWYDESWPKDQNAEMYDRLVSEIKSVLGVDFLGGSIPYHIIEKDGYFFRQHPNYRGVMYKFAERVSDKLPQHPDGELLCTECGGMSFKIIFVQYGVVARCSECGGEEEIYSG